jgi:hypothetical protein
MQCVFSSLWYHNLFADSSQIMPDSICWLFLLFGLWYHNLPASKSWHPHFLNNCNFSRLYLMAAFVFRTMMSQFTRQQKMTPTLFWTTLIFPCSIWWLWLFSRLWYHNLPAGGRWHPLFLEQLWFFQTLSDGYICFPDYDITNDPLAKDDTHSFLNNSNFYKINLMAIFAFRTMIPKFTRWWKMTPTLFRTTLIFSHSI